MLQFARHPAKTKLRLFEGTNYAANGTSLVHVRYYFPSWIADRLSAKALSGPTHAIKVVEEKVACMIDHADQIVQPVIATCSIAQSLMIPVGTAVPRAIRVYYDTQSRNVEILDAAYHPTNYRYSARLYPRGLSERSR